MHLSSGLLKPSLASRAPTATTMLLYWLLILCGLEGLTVLRMHTPSSDLALAPLWLGTIAGVALGQLVAWLRVRTWVPAVITFFALWLLPAVFVVLYELFGTGADTCLLAFFPAAICGYLSLSERGALVSFWYPAVLWMVVILDGDAAPTNASGGAAAFNARATLPFIVGLAALFVAFLRARETRRVAIWRAHGSVRIAAPLTRSVLRTSPVRAASQHAWTLLVGAAALVLAAWIAPHLWQKDLAKGEKPPATTSTITSAQAANALGSGAVLAPEAPCCPERGVNEKKRVREYFPLVHGHDEEREHQALLNSCTACRNGKPIATWPSSSSSGGGGSGGGSGDSRGSAIGAYDGPLYGDGAYGGGTSGGAYYGGGNYYGTDPAVAPAVPLTPTTTTTTTTPTTHPSNPTTTTATTSPTTTAQRSTTTTGSSSTTSSKHEATPVVVVPTSAPRHENPPWTFALAFSAACLGVHLLLRALRRQVTLRHLRRPFWSETLDQRISNHWQRMLIGLGDAGIHPTLDEQPHALARRVGIDGMDTCATILERVRHGVRVDDTDLETMDSAASAIYRTAREKAGFAGRATAWLRWPLA